MKERKYILFVKPKDTQENLIYLVGKVMELKEIYSILQEIKVLDYFCKKEITLCIK